MSTLLRFVVMSLAALIEKVFQGDPHFTPRSRHLVRFTRSRDDARPLTHGARPEDSEAVAGLKP